MTHTRTSMVAGALAVLLVFGCGEGESEPDEEPAVEPSGEEPSGEEPSGEEPSGEEPSDDAPSDDAPLAGDRDPEASAAAQAAYRAAMAAYSRGDADGYFGAYADTLSCFFGSRRYAIEDLRAARGPAIGSAGVYVTEIVVLRSSAEEVVLVDLGMFYRLYGEQDAPTDGRPYLTRSDSAVEQGTHSKLVVLRRGDDGWRITAETNRRNQSCVEDGLMDLLAVPQAFERCSSAHAGRLRQCDEACQGPTPGNACNVCPDEALCSLFDCLGVPAPDDAGCAQ